MISKSLPQSHKGVNLELLINGEQYYSRLWEDIGCARNEVFIDAYIVLDDCVGGQLSDALCGAAKRGVEVHLTIDGFGSAELPQAFCDRLESSGVTVHVFDRISSFGRRFKFSSSVFRRMHQKIVVIDGDVAYVGGINFGEDHLAESGSDGKQDYMVRAEGAVADTIHTFMVTEIARRSQDESRSWELPRRRVPRHWVRDKNASENEVFFVTRDNREHYSEIERFYKVALRRAQSEIIIANAYFFPSYGFIWQLRRAVRRGVRVVLILQGKPDIEYVRYVTSTLYDYLLHAGVEVYEFTQRSLHGKVAVFDEAWCTAGSSNLDPLSFAMNAEANLFIHDREFAGQLRNHLMQLREEHCHRVTREEVPRQRGWRHLVRVIVFHLMRRFPHWLGRGTAVD